MKTLSILTHLQNALEKFIGPIADFVSNNKIIKALTSAFLGTIPITIGIVVIAILGNISFDPWVQFLNSTGLYDIAQQMVSSTQSLLAVYIAAAIGYSYCEIENQNKKIGSLISLASFISLMPIISVDSIGGTVLKVENFGSNGIFIAIIFGLAVSWMYCKLMNSKLKIKLPQSIPPMVADSLSPTFAVMIIFTFIFAVKYGLSLTNYGDVFKFINDNISKPVLSLGTNPLTPILAFTFMNLLWFFGIHPSPVFNCFLPILIGAITANIEAMSTGQPMPYITFQIVFFAVYLGGNGNTLGLCIATLFAKSEKYKAMRKIVVPANLFNINEPIIFGFPVMLNPVYFIPMVFSSLLAGGVVYGICQFINFSINPTVNLPWVTPGFITAFLTGGIALLIVWLIALFLHFIIYLPFFLIDDNKAYQEELEAKKS